ncbi:MAG: LysR family transcriptional regulator [Planctomycetes bacterium]|nr:LysR family transcriptional regulator [Planctomycetota bacterium]
MELRHLRTFAAAAELQSFTQAARRLSLTQAAVSQHVAALEKELKVSLFARSGRSVSPTDAGRRLYDYARRILDLLAEAEHEVGDASQVVRGTLSIAASTVPAESLLPELLLEFHERHPDVRPVVIVSDSAAATRAVENDEAELGFIGEPPHASQLASRPLASDELVLVLPAEHELARRKRLKPADLAGLSFLMREPGSGSRRCVEHALEQAGLSPGELTVALEMNSNDAIRRAVERGAGAAFLSRAVVKHELEAGRLKTVAVEGFTAERQLYLITHVGRIATPPARAFLEFLGEKLPARGEPVR